MVRTGGILAPAVWFSPRIANAEQSTKVLQVFEIDYFYGWYKDNPSTENGGFMLKKWLLFGLLATIGIQCTSTPKDTVAETQRFNEFLDKAFDEFLSYILKACLASVKKKITTN